ncbi:hypothetical protein KM043_008354 [Ampulex compressa]|nr:hypothetical protein KM043_008354 [Ampulex compressa]
MRGPRTRVQSAVSFRQPQQGPCAEDRGPRSLWEYQNRFSRSADISGHGKYIGNPECTGESSWEYLADGRPDVLGRNVCSIRDQCIHDDTTVKGVYRQSWINVRDDGSAFSRVCAKRQGSAGRFVESIRGGEKKKMEKRRGERREPLAELRLGVTRANLFSSPKEERVPAWATLAVPLYRQVFSTLKYHRRAGLSGSSPRSRGSELISRGSSRRLCMLIHMPDWLEGWDTQSQFRFRGYLR